MLTWLPRELARDTTRPRDALAVRVNQFDPSVLQLEQTSIEVLRKAIRANRASFPSQVPTFTRFDLPNLERRLVQLYFVSGWTFPEIGAKYKLTPGRVVEILDSWKRRAVKAGYIQHIPPAEDTLGLATQLRAPGDQCEQPEHVWRPTVRANRGVRRQPGRATGVGDRFLAAYD
jgi:hypothetical protein